MTRAEGPTYSSTNFRLRTLKPSFIVDTEQALAAVSPKAQGLLASAKLVMRACPAYCGSLRSAIESCINRSCALKAAPSLGART